MLSFFFFGRVFFFFLSYILNVDHLFSNTFSLDTGTDSPSSYLGYQTVRAVAQTLAEGKT